ncbi:conserved hypothetical protein [Talaromyces stipitatus ATCC 10500]|uniref:PH domain protein n=1 Tax=Talaromyces stipitatus (strain ATCC 10500 / CBS 375.48 / QM 6759 / NRRL 1006) TaxID=441959 RepID=B8M1L7_TALSN|nr:uncharacterized protein TSTA_093500 [Talaromyces stipitatus ATCC 10500]EED22104.1 conserved hypothetical protein [Talaromyces stipitatus ATCC 10500]
MAAQLAAFASNRILKENVKNSFGKEDPYFEQVPASRLGRAFGKKTRKQRKAIPPGLSANDAKILNRVKRRAYRLDYSLFNLCGIRFGWGAVIGLIPFAGDGLDAALAMMVVRDCDKVDGGLPNSLRSRMLMNVVLDFVIGLVPFIGDLADAIYKCNTRNAILLEKHLRDKASKVDKARAKKGHPTGESQRPVDLSIPEEFDRYEEGLLPEPPSYTEAPLSEPTSIEHGVETRRPAESQPAELQPANNPQSRRDGSWFGGRKQKRSDLESGGGRH